VSPCLHGLSFLPVTERQDEQYLDLAAWPRREHFELFRGVAQPFFAVTVEVDVTSLVTAGGSFTIAALYHVMRAAHETPGMHLRVHGDRVRVHPRLRLSTTVLRPDETFGFAVLDPIEDFRDFSRHATAELDRAGRVAPLTIPEGDDIVYHSTLPWLRFTHFTNAMHSGDSVPRVVFGRRYQDGSHWRMPVAVEVHHAVMDGLDVHRFLEAFQGRIANGLG
jgi:chloramphenicol O-acetyltransferase type A